MGEPIDILGVAAARLHAAKRNWQATMPMQFSRNAENAAQLAHAELAIAMTDMDRAKELLAALTEAQNVIPPAAAAPPLPPPGPPQSAAEAPPRPGRPA